MSTVQGEATGVRPQFRGPARLGWALFVVQHSDPARIGERWLVTGTAIVGRDRSGERGWALGDTCVSGRHAELRAPRDGLTVTDLYSSNGTCVGSVRLEPGAARALEPNDLVQVGKNVVLLVGRVDHDGPDGAVPDLLGSSDGARWVRCQVLEAARTSENVLVLGESGVGKEVVARAIHDAGGAGAGHAWVERDMSSVPESLAESVLFGYRKGAFSGAKESSDGLLKTAGGTLFLDEIGKTPSSVQPRLRRAIDARRFLPVGSRNEEELRARIIAATSEPLPEMARSGGFDADLYNRLSARVIRVPPLRERLADVAVLAWHFLGECDPTLRWDLCALAYLLGHPWPGNVRQLRDVVRVAAAGQRAGSVVVLRNEQLDQLERDRAAVRRPAGAEPPDAWPPVDRLGRDDASRLLETLDYRIADAAGVLGCERRELIARLRMLGCHPLEEPEVALALAKRFQDNAAQLAAHLGLDPSGVRHSLKKLGIR